MEKLANQREKPILAAPKTSPASNLQTSFCLSPTCPEEVQKVISNLDAKKAVPINDIPIKYLKLAGTTISKSLSDHFNTCILDSKYPDGLKIAQITVSPFTNQDQKKAAQIIERYLTTCN